MDTEDILNKALESPQAKPTLPVPWAQCLSARTRCEVLPHQSSVIGADPSQSRWHLSNGT